VFVEEVGERTLEAETDDPVRVLIDGEEVYDTTGGSVERNAAALNPGWHAVEIELQKETEGGNLELAWVDSAGRRLSLVGEDLFPIADWGGWLHERTVQEIDSGARTTTQRIDFSPHRASTTVIRAGVPASSPVVVVEERYSAVWEPPAAGTYILSVEPLIGGITVLLDGQPVALTSTGQLAGEAQVTVDAGPHQLEVVQTLPPDPNTDAGWSGFRVALSQSVRAADGSSLRVPVPLIVQPYEDQG
jgi:hypothetical protein